jgi:hypothetical protein
MPANRDTQINLLRARELRDQGHSYRQIRRALRLSRGQASHIKRTLVRQLREANRLRRLISSGSARDVPVNSSGLPPSLRSRLVGAGYVTLGDIVDALDDANRPGPASVPGVGPAALRRIHDLLASVGLYAASGEDLRATVEALFPELRGAGSG